MPDFGKVFLGSTPADHRRFVTAALAHLRSRGFSRVVVPCCGQFTLVKCAIAAGFDKAHILASDVSLFSSLLGYYYAGRPLSELPFAIRPGRLAKEYERCRTDTERLALLLLHMKLAQLTERDFERRYAEDLLGRADAHMERMRQGLETFREYYSGIRYEIEDVRRAVEHNDPSTVIVWYTFILARRSRPSLPPILPHFFHPLHVPSFPVYATKHPLRSPYHI